MTGAVQTCLLLRCLQQCGSRYGTVFRGFRRNSFLCSILLHFRSAVFLMRYGPGRHVIIGIIGGKAPAGFVAVTEDVAYFLILGPEHGRSCIAVGFNIAPGRIDLIIGQIDDAVRMPAGILFHLLCRDSGFRADP